MTGDIWGAVRSLDLEDWGNLGTVVAAIAGAVAAIAAWWSARATRDTAKEMERARVAQTRPLVLLTARRDTKKLLLVMKNYGGPAANVQIRFAERYPWAHGVDLNDAPLFHRPIPVMLPEEELSVVLGSWPEYWFTYSLDAEGVPMAATDWSGRPEEFSFHLTYEDPLTDTVYGDNKGLVSLRPLAPTAPELGLLHHPSIDHPRGNPPK